MANQRISGFYRFRKVDRDALLSAIGNWKEGPYGSQFLTLEVAGVHGYKKDFVVNFVYKLRDSETISQFLRKRREKLTKRFDERSFICSVAPSIVSF